MTTNRHAQRFVLGLIAVCSVSVASRAMAETDTGTTPLTYREAEWYGSTFWTGPDWTRVGKGWHHPGQNTPSVRRFTAPRDGRVTITGRVFKLHLAGDGIRAGIRHNDREVWKAELAGQDDKGVEPNLTLDVKKGDALRFVVDKRGNIGCDTTGWDPVIAYADGEKFQASAAFAAKKHGAGGWFYEMLGQGRDAPVAELVQLRTAADDRSLTTSATRRPVFGPEAFPEPPTVAITAAAADELLKTDWLAQRGTEACAEACRQEFARAERILQRTADRLDPAALGQWRKTLAEWRGRLAAGSSRIRENSGTAAGRSAPQDNPNSHEFGYGELPRLAEPASDELYLGLRRMKRELLLADPAIDFSSILCIDNPYVHGSEAIHEIRHRNEDTATPGGRLLVLDSLRPDAQVRKLAPQGAPAAFWRPDVSFDGRRVLFCMKSADEPAYHLYEVGLDGTGWRQITAGDYNDLDPIYTPDGNMVFCTTRCNHYLRCGGSKFRMFVLARSDLQGNNIYFISANNEADYTPALLPDGRILYTRWEYVDKEVIRVQSLWTVNPDGTGLGAFWGNQSRWPDMLLNARQIPGTRKVLFSAVGHHDAYAGPLGIVDQNEGMNYPDGVYNLTPHLPWAEVGAGPADQVVNPDFQAPRCYMAFQTPFPISKDLMLVSARRGKHPQTTRDAELGWFQLYLMDYDGNLELLYQGAYNILHAQPIRSRAKPPVLPSPVRWPGNMASADQRPDDGLFYNSDVYEGTTIPRGMVKSLRVLEIESQTYCDGVRSTGREADLYRKQGAFPQFGLFGETVTSFLMDDATKRILGTVPVQEDGSVYFQAPPVRALYFQLLDGDGRCLHTMRSFTHVMPGETRSCVGCHETRGVAPGQKSSLVNLPAPSEISPPPWGDETVSFPRFVQPILDEHCVRCHGAEKTEAEIDLTHRTEPGTLLSWPYVTLVFGKNPKTVADLPETSIAGPIFPYHTYPNPEVKYPTQDTVVPPLTAMSYRSRLIELATDGKHYDVRISPDEEARLVAWVDALCPYLGLEEIIAKPDITPEDYFNQAVYQGLSYPSKMRTAPIIHRAFCQDDFQTQLDRQPKDAAGNVLPAVEVKDGRRSYRIPTQDSP